MKGFYLDATPAAAALMRRLLSAPGPHVDTPHIDIHVPEREITADDLRALLPGYDFVLDDHSYLPTGTMRLLPGLRHVVFLGTGARSYMNPDELAALGISVHLIRNYGDTAVAEHAFALLWAAARDVAAMDRAVRAGTWPRTEGMQLTGRTLGLIGFGGIAAEMARLALGAGMRVLAWNRAPRDAAGVAFVDIDTLLAESDAVSLHLLLTDETRGFLSADRIARMRPGAMLVNTARGALVDEAAMVAALRSGHLRHAALDVFEQEPLPPGHVLATLPNVTLSPHAAFRTPEASESLLRRALDIARRLAAA